MDPSDLSNLAIHAWRGAFPDTYTRGAWKIFQAQMDLDRPHHGRRWGAHIGTRTILAEIEELQLEDPQNNRDFISARSPFE